MRVVVVGAGVVGLTAAVRLLAAGHRVDVLARDLPLETTSAVAAAIWYPHRALPQDRVAAWGARTFEVLTGLARTEPGAGVRLRSGRQLIRRAHRPGERPGDRPWWADGVPDLAAVPAAALPAGYEAGWSFTTPVVEMPVHLRWLVDRVEALGGTLTRTSLGALPAPRAGGADVVVDCAGLGARLLAGDRSVVPVRGQVVRVARPAGLVEWVLDADGPTYVVPREHDVVVGGTDEEGEWSRTPDPATGAALLARATALVPALAGAPVLAHRVGLRPVRPAVRLERVGDVVHCYGHGGAGITLSWGCAEEITRTLAQEPLGTVRGAASPA